MPKESSETLNPDRPRRTSLVLRGGPELSDEEKEARNQARLPPNPLYIKVQCRYN